MPFIPHTPDEIEAMLATIKAKSLDDLFDEIPSSLPKAQLNHIDEGLNELQITRLMSERAPNLEMGGCFIGAGAYEHHIPAAVWDITGRGEFYTAYTPYQAEASQGSLQLIYEYQSMMAHLMGVQVSNASMYDGATALVEAVLMAVRIKRGKAKRVLVPQTIHPAYREVLNTVLKHQSIEIEDLPYCPVQGAILMEALERVSGDGLAAVVIAQPNFFGTLEEVDQITNMAHELGALVIGVVNPIAMALLKPPGQWGDKGADIVCGEGQPLGVPLAAGGPYFGFMCCNKNNVRQIPGRIVGRTTDEQGRVGYTLTLQAREQHIRRGKATSNICTNQGLMVTAASIYLSLMGAQGLRNVAAACYQNARVLKERLQAIENVDLLFHGPTFHEFTLRTKKDVAMVLAELNQHGIQGGLNLKNYYPELGNCLLVCATETKTLQDLERYQQLLAKIAS